MGADVDGRDVDLRLGQEVLGERSAVGLDRAVEVVHGERVGRVLHRVGGDHQRVVAIGVGGLEIAFEGDRHGQVADAVTARIAGDADEPDRRLAVAVRRQFDHAGSSAAADVRVAYRSRAMSMTASRARRDLGVAVRLERGGHPGEQLLA